MVSGALLTRESLPLPGLANSWSKWLLCECAFRTQAEQSGVHISQPSRLLSSRPPGLLSICLHRARAKCQTERGSPYAQSPRRLCKLADPKPIYPAYPASPNPSLENHNRGSYSASRPSSCLPTGPGGSPCDPAWCGAPPASRQLGIKNFSPDIVTSACLTILDKNQMLFCTWVRRISS